jgi:hypothetical protein
MAKRASRQALPSSPPVSVAASLDERLLGRSSRCPWPQTRAVRPAGRLRIVKTPKLLYNHGHRILTDPRCQIRTSPDPRRGPAKDVEAGRALPVRKRRGELREMEASRSLAEKKPNRRSPAPDIAEQSRRGTSSAVAEAAVFFLRASERGATQKENEWHLYP